MRSHASNGLDQRGVTRGAPCDIGAYEFEAPQTGSTLLVNTANDHDSGICSDHDCTLREAINAANAISGADTITFAASLNGTPITLVGSQLPAVTSIITITGNGAANTIIQANENPNTASYRVLEVSGGNLTLDGVTVKNGQCSGSCATYSDSGGGVFNYNGTLAITNSTFSGNSASGYGGGVLNDDSTLTVTNSTFSGNSAYLGGGVDNEGTLTMMNSTFSGNSATYGGGIFNDGTATITNSTFFGNSAISHGGGVFNWDTLTIANSAFSGNSATYGGGIDNYSNTVVTLKNTIVANATSGGNCGGIITANTYNLASDNSCGGATQKTSLEINLGDLDDYSGSTQTFALLPGSAAIDAGDDTICDDNPGPTNLDQRGVSRVGNGDHCDIGAYESRGFTLTKSGGDNQITGINTAFTNPLSVTLNETGGRALSGATIRFTAPLSGASLTSTDVTALTNASGIASISITANDTLGSYNVTANASASSVDFALSNIYNTLTYTAGAGGTIDGTTPQIIVNPGDSGTAVTAMADTGYHFVNWSDGVLTAARTDTAVSGDISVTANFAIDTYDLTYTAGANGSVTTPETSPTTHNSGASVPITAEPIAGYHFVNWTGDVSTVDDVNAADTTITMNGDYAITANFAINTYDLTYTAGANGSVTTPETSPTTHNSGDIVTITAEPAAGYHFVNWTEDVGTVANVNAADTTITMDGDYVITANFAINTYTLTYTAGANGSITGDSPQTVISGESGTEVTAEADTGYHFVDWSDGVLTASRTDTNVTGDISVTAAFAIDTYSLTYTAGANGSITGDSPQIVTSGADGTEVTAVADAGYHFVDWSDASTTNPRTDTNVLANVSVTANFAINSTVTYYSSGSYDGWILETGEKTSKGGTLDSKSTTFRLGDDKAKKQYRGILSFSTGAKLPDTATITKVTLKVRKQGIVGGGNPVTTFKGFMADIKRGYIGTSASLQAADFQTPASKTYGPFKTVISGVWYNIDLTSGRAYINKTSASSGLTQIRLRFYLDDNNNATANYLSLYSGNTSTVANRPQLVIEYYLP